MIDVKLNALVAQTRWLIQSTWQRRWQVVCVAWAVSILGAVGISQIPERFEASARIFVDTQTVLKPLMRELAYQPDIDQQVRMLARTLISRPNVGRLIDRPELGFKFASAKERDATLSRLMEQIKMVAADRGNLYSIAYKDANPARALQIVEAAVDLFVKSSTDNKKRDSMDANRFIDEQIQSNEAKLIEAETRLKDFKLRNFGVSGVSNQDYFVRMSTLSDEVTKLRSDLRAAEQSRDALRRELAAEDPQLPAQPLPGTAPVVATETESRLESLRRQLDDLLRRFTDQHPDVVSLRRAVTQLELQNRQEIEARARAANRTSGLAATSPVYQRIRISLAESEAQVASLRSQLAAQEARLASIRALAGRVPQVEAEFAQLNRDYDVMRRNFDQLVARRESASLGVRLDESSQMAEFRLVEPPRVTPTPVFPGHLHMAFITVLVALASGIGAALVMATLRRTVDDAESLAKLSGRPHLGSVGLATTPASRRSALQNLKWLAGAGAAWLVFQAGMVAWVATQALRK